jgi:AraC family transcriptional activator of pobA
MNLTRSIRGIPSFSLYGEQSGEVGPTEPLHIEDIQSRSRKYLWQIGTHRHTRSSQCVFVMSGPVVVDLEEAHLEFDGPAVIIIPSGSAHGFAFRADSHGYVLTMDLDRLLSAASASHRPAIATLFSVPRACHLNSDRRLAARAAQLFGTLLQEFREPDSFAAPVCGWLACSVLWMLAARLVSSAPMATMVRHDAERLRRFRAAVEAHFLQHWPVARYARGLAVSESSLNRLCRALAGGTAFDLIQRRLALEARRRLVHVAGPVGGIAAQLGFKDPAYFCRFFRKHNGTSPSAFRRRHGGG